MANKFLSKKKTNKIRMDDTLEDVSFSRLIIYEYFCTCAQGNMFQ